MTFLKDKKGISSALMALYITFFFMMLFMLIYDVGFLYIKKTQLNDALKFSNLMIYKGINTDLLREGKLFIDVSEAETIFREAFRENLKLDHNLRPDSPSSPASGEVIISAFMVKNPDDLTMYDTLGNEMKNLSIHSRAKMPVKPTFLGLFHEVTIEAAVTTDAPFIELTSP